MTLTAEQRAKAQKRFVSVDVSSANADDRTVIVAIASETPCPSVYKINGKETPVLERLKCAPGSVNFDRLLNSGPVLFNHDAGNLIGVFERVWIDADAVIRAQIRIGPGALADQCLAQIRAGVLTKFSIGFWIDEWTDDGVDRETGMKRVLVTLFTIFEGSFVAIPADDTVGVNRSLVGATDTASNTEKQISPEPTPVAAAAPVPDARAINSTDTGTENKTRHMNRKDINAKIRSLVAKYGKLVKDEAALRSFADAAIDSGEQTDADVQGFINSNLAERSAETSSVTVSAPKSQKREAILATLREVGAGNQRSLKINFRASAIDGSATKGGEMISTEVKPTIDALRAKSVLLGAGAQLLTGLTGNISYPRTATAAAAAWAAKGAAVAGTAPATGSFPLTPKRLGLSFTVDKAFFVQVPDADMWLENQLNAALALGLDKAGLSGAGGDAPEGILSADGVAEITFAAGGISWAKVTEALGAIETANYDVNSCKWIVSPTTMAKAMNTQIAANLPMIMGLDRSIAGFGSKISTQVGDGDKIVFGDAAQTVFGLWGDGYDITLDPFTRAAYNEIVVTAQVLADFGVLQPGAFVRSTNSAVSND